MGKNNLTVYAVFFYDDKWYCSLFYDVLVYSQEKTFDKALEATREGLIEYLQDLEKDGTPLLQPLTKEEVEKRAREDEKEGCVGKGWWLVPIEVYA